ncbi:hypothetical protein [Ferrimonas pelagia]|uniref:Uncharacterized protein n=1 Tax=Ferrimonas pelagia TaxID=1177826 RepID=A0ABP9F784_9GAMM
MYQAYEIAIKEHMLHVKKDHYPLSKVSQVEVKTMTWKNHLVRMLTLGLNNCSEM